MRWTKPAEDKTSRRVEERWAWAHPTFDLTLNKPLSEISRIEIDESGLMADVDRSNNVYSQNGGAE